MNIPMCLWLLSRVNLKQLRGSRDRWRRQIQSSPLGDADLMRHLELITAMVQASIAEADLLSQCRRSSRVQYIACHLLEQNVASYFYIRSSTFMPSKQICNVWRRNFLRSMVTTE